MSNMDFSIIHSWDTEHDGRKLSLIIPNTDQATTWLRVHDVKRKFGEGFVAERSEVPALREAMVMDGFTVSSDKK